jgi:hypothetical protein
MGWRDFQAEPYMDNMDNMDKTTESAPLNPYCPFNPPTGVIEKTANQGVPDSYNKSDRSPVFKAWLAGDELLTTGVCDDLAAEVINVTSDIYLPALHLFPLVAVSGDWQTSALVQIRFALKEPPATVAKGLITGWPERNNTRTGYADVATIQPQEQNANN